VAHSPARTVCKVGWLCLTRTSKALPDAASFEGFSVAELRALVGALVAEVGALRNSTEAQQATVSMLRAENQGLRDEVARLKICRRVRRRGRQAWTGLDDGAAGLLPRYALGRPIERRVGLDEVAGREVAARGRPSQAALQVIPPSTGRQTPVM